MIAYSFDRFYVARKIVLPSIGDLNFSKLNYDNTCAYIVCNTDSKKHMSDLMMFCTNIEPLSFIIKGWLNHTTTQLVLFCKNEIHLIIPQASVELSPHWCPAL